MQKLSPISTLTSLIQQFFPYVNRQQQNVYLKLANGPDANWDERTGTVLTYPHKNSIHIRSLHVYPYRINPYFSRNRRQRRQTDDIVCLFAQKNAHSLSGVKEQHFTLDRNGENNAFRWFHVDKLICAIFTEHPQRNAKFAKL